MRAADMTGLGRHLDLRLASNRFAVTASVLAGTVAGVIALLDGDGLVASLGAAAVAGAGVFAAWATARELDPDHAASATVAAPLAFLAYLIGPPSLGAAFAVMLGARVAARTSGVPPRIPDLVFLAGLAVYTATTATGVVAALTLGGALAIDRLLVGGAPRQQLWAGVGIAAVGIATAMVAGDWPGWRAPGAGAAALLAVGAVLAIAVIPTPTPRSTADRTRRPLDRGRVGAARLLALAAAAAYAAAAGGPGATALGPSWAAIIAVGLLALLRRARIC